MERQVHILSIVFVILLLNTVTSFGQSCTTTFPGGTVNWTALPWSCSGGGTAPTTTGTTYTEDLSVGTPSQLGNGDVLNIDISFTLNGNLTMFSNGSNPTITIPAGVTVIINGNLTDIDNNLIFNVNGTLIITGTLKAKNNTVFSGTGSISGGALDLGNSPSCAGACPGLSFGSCTVGGPSTFCGDNVTTANLYLWTGASSTNFQTAGNWSPTRTTPAASDVLSFSSSGTNRSIVNVPTQTIGKIFVTGSTTYSLTTSSSSKTLTLTSLEGAALQIDNGSTLTVGDPSFAVNVTLPSTGLGLIGGQLNLANGNLGAGSATLELHTNSAPLARTAGQVSLDGTSVLRFGSSSFTSGAMITLPDNIFVSSPTIASLTINRTNGATLGNQSITVSTGATFTLGDLFTNAAGRIKFSSSASNPTESANSKINGYAEMNLRGVGTGALNFLGFNMAAGADDIGSMTLVRRTGTSGINTFNANQSIASTWDVSSTSDPASGRNISFSWRAAFDNITTATNRFQVYIFNSGPGWTTVGTLQNLSAVGPPRVSATVNTTKLIDTFTLTDETQVLPVELLSFTANRVSDGVKLTWATASQKNFDHFSIERSGNGKDFVTIGKIVGDPYSVVRKDYSFYDAEGNASKAYYRLKNVDADGSFDYSQIVMVENNSDLQAVIYPNPTIANGQLNIDLSGDVGNGVQLFVFDYLGRVVKHANLFTLKNSIEMEGVAPGLYLVKVNMGARQFTSKVLVE
ncbi:MAG: T9SS type A sorting domain-containing protein [Cyclobacteriaceae bacterium]